MGTAAPPPAEMASSSGSGGATRTRFARQGSARLAYEVIGADDAVQAGAPVVVLLHDLLGDRSDLRPVGEALARSNNARVVLPDARGHGASAAFAGRRSSLPELAADVAAILDAEGVAAAHAAGHGLGATTALALALAKPGRVRSLTLVEPLLPALLAGDAAPTARAAGTELLAAARRSAEAADRGQPDRAVETWLNARYGAGWQERIPPARRGAIRRHAGALAAVLPALESFALDLEMAGRLQAPTLVARGATTTDAVRLTCARLATLLPTVAAGNPDAHHGTVAVSTLPDGTPGATFAANAGQALADLLEQFLNAPTASSSQGA